MTQNSGRLSFESRNLVIQIMPSVYVEVGPWDLAIDRDGFLFNGRTHSFGWIKGSGWHASRRQRPTLTARINAIPVIYKLAAVAIAAGCASYLGGI